MVQNIVNEDAVNAGHHLGIASLHVSKCNFWVDRMAAGHAEYLQVGVFITFIHLQMHRVKWSSVVELQLLN